MPFVVFCFDFAFFFCYLCICSCCRSSQVSESLSLLRQCFQINTLYNKHWGREKDALSPTQLVEREGGPDHRNKTMKGGSGGSVGVIHSHTTGEDPVMTHGGPPDEVQMEGGVCVNTSISYGGDMLVMCEG